MSDTGIVESLSQSVPERFLEAIAFIFRRLSNRNDSGFVPFIILAVNNHGNDSAKKSYAHPPFFSIVLTSVHAREHGILEHPRCILK